jgi:hypothetical protein
MESPLALLVRGRLRPPPMAGEPVRAEARLPKTAPVGRFVPLKPFAAVENLLGSRTKSAEEILAAKNTKFA